MPAREGAPTHRYINASPGCWSLYTEVLAREYGDAVLFGQVHQLTVDAYTAQHPGGAHPDKSVAVHLVGLRLALVDGIPQADIPRRRGDLVARTDAWPRLRVPDRGPRLTVFDVALVDRSAHADAVHRWAQDVWASWATRHAEIAALATTVTDDRPRQARQGPP